MANIMILEEGVLIMGKREIEIHVVGSVAINKRKKTKKRFIKFHKSVVLKCRLAVDKSFLQWKKERMVVVVVAVK